MVLASLSPGVADSAPDFSRLLLGGAERGWWRGHGRVGRPFFCSCIVGSGASLPGLSGGLVLVAIKAARNAESHARVPNSGLPGRGMMAENLLHPAAAVSSQASDEIHGGGSALYGGRNDYSHRHMYIYACLSCVFPLCKAYPRAVTPVLDIYFPGESSTRVQLLQRR